MTTYNGEKFIREQLESILCQIGENDEIVISDDSSIDKTVSLIESYNDKRIKIFKNNHFRSPIFNLQNALKYCKGDYIFLSDQDDVWFPNKINVMLPLITKENLVMSNAEIVDGDLVPEGKTLDDWRTYRKGFINNLFISRYVGCCMAFHRDKLKYFLPFPKRIKAHDVWLGLLSELNGGVLYLHEPLIKYRRHTENISTVGSKSRNNLWFMFTYRIYFLVTTIIRALKFH